MNARRRTRSIQINPANLPMRHAASHHDGMQLVRAVQIIGVAALPAQQDRIFLAGDRLANRESVAGQQSGVEWRIH